jgi:hypothetical protein
MLFAMYGKYFSIMAFGDVFNCMAMRSAKKWIFFISQQQRVGIGMSESDGSA